MARQRSGSLEYRQGKGFFLRYTVDVVKDGKTVAERRWTSLDTHDKVRAERLKKKIIADLNAGRLVAEAREDATASTVAEDGADHIERRKAAGVAMARDEEGYFRNHVVPVIGPMHTNDVRPADIRRVIQKAIDGGLKKGSVSHVRRLMHRLFGELYRDERIDEDPTARVRLRDFKMREMKKKRVTLTDAEIATYLAAPRGDLEVKILSLVARAEGGMRTCELNRWTWADINRDTFAMAWIPRGKGADAQELEIPTVVGLFLRKWWEAHGKPESGPVFPVRRGKRKGEHKADRSSYARSLRRDLMKAGVTRHEVHHETDRTLPADFHSFRRAFAGALARSGVNAQTAMHLSSHSDMRTHMGYVVEQIREIPAGVIPHIDPANHPLLAQPVDDWTQALPGWRKKQVLTLADPSARGHQGRSAHHGSQFSTSRAAGKFRNLRAMRVSRA